MNIVIFAVLWCLSFPRKANFNWNSYTCLKEIVQNRNKITKHEYDANKFICIFLTYKVQETQKEKIIFIKTDSCHFCYLKATQGPGNNPIFVLGSMVLCSESLAAYANPFSDSSNCLWMPKQPGWHYKQAPKCSVFRGISTHVQGRVWMINNHICCTSCNKNRNQNVCPNEHSVNTD